MTYSPAPAPLRPDELERLGERFTRLLLRTRPDTQGLALRLYRLLAQGGPVATEELAGAAGLTPARVSAILAGWPAIQYDPQGRVTGFWGLTCEPRSAHRFLVNGRPLYTWCAWDSLFLPELLAATAQVESRCPQTGETVRLVVSPERVERAEPEGTVMSLLEPTEDIMTDVVARFCSFVHFFPFAEAGTRWCAGRPGLRLLTLPDAHALGRRKNRGQFGPALLPGSP
jgi:alkylmercury lyase